MPNNEPAPGDNVAGGANPNDNVSGGEQSASSKPLFVGFIYPSPMDENGALKDQPLSEGLGSPQMAMAVYAYDSEAEGKSLEVHAGLDKKLGQPFFKAYVYPVKDDGAIQLISFGGGGGGKAVLGGAATLFPIYMGHIFATLPAKGDAGGESNSGNTDAGNGPAPAGGTPPNG